MIPRLRFSLKLTLAVVSIFAVVLGFTAYSASRQRRAVESLKSYGVIVLYDNEVIDDPRGFIEPFGVRIPRGPEWLRKAIGRDWFDTVRGVDFSNSTFTGSWEESIALLGLLPRAELLVCGPSLYGTSFAPSKEQLRQLMQVQDWSTVWFNFDASKGWTIDELAQSRSVRALYLLEQHRVDTSEVAPKRIVDSICRIKSLQHVLMNMGGDLRYEAFDEHLKSHGITRY